MHDFPGGSVVKNLPASAGDSEDSGSIPELGRSPGGGSGNLPQYSCLENPMDGEAWQATVPGVPGGLSENSGLPLMLLLEGNSVLVLGHGPQIIWSTAGPRRASGRWRETGARVVPCARTAHRGSLLSSLSS